MQVSVVGLDISNRSFNFMVCQRKEKWRSANDFDGRK